MRSERYDNRGRRRPLPAGVAIGMAGMAFGLAFNLAGVTAGGAARAADTQTALPLAPHGTPFHFEVIESHDARYLGDTPAHVGKDGGLTVRPQVALGDPVYRTVRDTRTVVGRITRVAWNRVSGSLEVEFHPEPFRRVAVGDDVWIDLNPAPAPAEPVDGH